MGRRILAVSTLRRALVAVTLFLLCVLLGHDALMAAQATLPQPHHVSIVALAERALPSLRDNRLRVMAASIVATQEAEIAQLRELRAVRFGSPDTTPMDDDMLAALPTIMPEDAADGHAMEPTRPEMAMLMNGAALIAAFCPAPDPDLAFAELTLAHHQMAVDSSLGLLETPQDAELRGLAERVVAAQAAELTILRRILDERAVASPTP